MKYTGIHPFWFWNGKLTKIELKRQIHEMADKGISGFFIHSRQGLSIPYLSKTFFKMINYVIKEAAKTGLSVHLYDEYPYPSGAAGGSVVIGNPVNMGTYLIQKQYKLTGGKILLKLPQGKVLNCTLFHIKDKQILWKKYEDLKSFTGVLLQENTYHETGLTSYNRKRFLANHPAPCLSVKLPYGEKYLLSVSIQALIDTNKYWGYYTDTLNKKAVKEFINLTHEQYAKHFRHYFGNSIHSIFSDEIKPGWSIIIPETFKKQYGYDLLDKLPALHLEDHPEHYRIKKDLQHLVERLFTESFEKPVSRWCREHKLAYCGEKFVFNLSQLRYMDIPGCEPGHTKAGALPDLLGTSIRENAKAVSSAAYFFKKKGCLCECFHSLGWGGTLLDARIILEGLALLGITMMVPHGFFYNTHGLTKHDAPPSFFFQMPYWPLMNCLSKRINNIIMHFTATKINAQILLYEPSGSIPDRNEKEVSSRIQYLLMENHLDFLMADRKILDQTSEKFKVLIIPPLKRIEEGLLDIVKNQKKYSVVILAANYRFNCRNFIRKIKRIIRPSINFTVSGDNPGRLWLASRINKKGRKSWFFLNTGNQEMEILFKGQYNLAEKPLDNISVPSLYENKRIIKPFESFLIIEEKSRLEILKKPIVNISIPNPVKIIPKNKNLLRLGEWDLSIIDSNHKILETHRVNAKPIINQLSDGQFSYVPDLIHNFGCSSQLTMPELDIVYKTSFKCRYSGKVELVIEPDSISGDWVICINDSRNIDVRDFTKTDAHIYGSMGVDITETLQKGVNKIEIKLKTGRQDGGLLSAVFLAGNFSVFNNTLKNMRKKGVFENYSHNGLPFYSGIITYSFDLELDKPAAGKSSHCILKTPPGFQEAVTISINDSRFFHMPWIPYQTIIPRDIIKQGKNKIVLNVYTSLSRSFEGMYFNTASHKYENINRI